MLPYTNMTAELCGIVLVNNPSLVSITESWLNSNIPYSAVAIGNNFNGVHRRDRPTPGTGVLVYVNRKYYVCTWLLNLEENGKELLWPLRLKPTSISRQLVSSAIIGEHYPPGLSAVDALEGNV
jgi:hypothetical protein